MGAYPFLLLLREFYFCCVRLTKCCSQVTFSFFGDLLSTPHFPFLCCRPESNTKRSKPAVPYFGRQDLLSKRKGIYFFERVLFIPLEASKECLKCFLFFQPKKKYIYIYKSQLKLIKYKFSHYLFNQGFCILHKIQNSLFRFKNLLVYIYC